MTLYIAHNVALESASTGITAGTSYAAGAKVAIQLGIPSGGQIELVEWGISMDGSAAATPANVALRSTATASTVTTAHSTTTVKPYLDPNAAASRMTMSTTGTGYGNGAITSATTLRVADRQFVAPTSQFVKIWPQNEWPKYGATGAAEFVQLLINTSATVNAYAYIIWNEII